MRMSQSDRATSDKRPIFFKALAYGAPYLGINVIYGPVITVLGGIYAKYYGLALTSIAMVMLIARVFDAVTDPIIGYYADRWRERTGSRKPLIACGALLVVPCSYCLFLPPDNVSIGYFAFWYIAFYLALTIYTIPYLAWAHDFTANTREKTLAFSSMTICSQGGSAIFYLLPLLPLFASSDITPEILHLTVFVGLGLLLPGLFLALKAVPSGHDSEPVSQTPSQVTSSQAKLQVAQSEQARSLLAAAQPFFAVFRAMLANRPFILYVCAFMCLGLAAGMWFGMLFIFADSYLELGERFSEISLWGMICGVCATPVWYRLAVLWGKRNAWLLAITIMAIALFFAGFLAPGSSGFSLLFIINMAVVFAIASTGVIGGPMLCDTIDYGRLKDRQERSASYFSVLQLLTKFQMAVGGALSMGIAGWFGFDLHMAQQTDSAIFGLRLGVAWGPALFALAAIVLIALSPLTEKRISLIRRRLDARDKRRASNCLELESLT